MEEYKDKKQKAYEEWFEYAELCYDLVSGTKTMLAKSTGYNPEKDYLPKEEGESIEKFRIRKRRTRLFNAFKKTANRFSGETFKKSPQYHDLDPSIEALKTNIDGNNTNMTKFLINAYEHGICFGASVVMLDYSETGATGNKTFIDNTGVERILSKEEVLKRGWRPFWRLISAKDIIASKFEKTNNINSLVSITIRENSYDEKGVLVERRRVVEVGRQVVYIKQKSESGESQFVFENEILTNLDFLPICVWSLNDQIGDFIAGIPVLYELAELNLLHFQSSSDQRNILHQIRVPILFGKRLKKVKPYKDDDEKDEGEDFQIGSGSMIYSDDAGASLNYVEHSGSGLSAGKEDLETLKNEMALFGLTIMLSQKPGDTTATERALNTSENDSTLKMWGLSFFDFANQILDMTKKIMGNSELSGHIECGVDFSIGSLSDVSTILSAVSSGVIPKRVALDELKRRGIIADKWNLEEVFQMLISEQKQLTVNTPQI